MGNGFWLAVGQMCQMCFWTVRYLPRGDWRQLPRRTLMFGITIPVLIFFQLIHWLGFALDELLFRKYRKVDVVKPIFVTGIPRSGTTHLQRVLAENEQLTSMQTWECFFAPSISERHMYRMFGNAFKPVIRMFSLVSFPFVKNMKSIHQLGLNEAEEDFVALLPINACFLLVVLFPEVSHYWRLSQFDSAVPAGQKRKILAYYHRVIQKHLYFHGADKRYLCKNPSFLTWIQSLSLQYEDASFVLCEREPEKTVPSQLSSLQPTWRLFYGENMSESFSKQIVSMLAKYYHYMDGLPLNDVNGMRLPMSILVSDLRSAISQVSDHCQIEMTNQFSTALDTEIAKASRYKSSHKYSKTEIYDWHVQADLFPVDGHGFDKLETSQ